MYIEKKENRLKQEISISLVGVFDKESVFICDREIKEALNNIEWEKIILDFDNTEDVDIEAIKLLWELKEIANSMQKSLEFQKMNGKIAVAFKVLGFTEKFNIDINIDEDIINKIVMLGEYEEPLYMCKTIDREISIKDKTISLESISSFVDEVIKKFEVDLKEWLVIPDSLKNKLIFLLETNNIPDIEKAEEYLTSLIIDKYKIESSMYILENGSFSEYYERKRNLGIPSKVISIPKVIRNPYTKQYFLGKIDERY